MDRRACGFTLLDLIFATVLVAMLLGFGVPNLIQFINNQRAYEVSYSISRALRTARAESIERGRAVTLCGLSPANTCQKDSIERIVAFLDENADRVLDADEEVILDMSPSSTAGTLDLRASLNKNYIIFTPSGRAKQAGRFIYCPDSGRRAEKRAVIFSLSGRSYTKTELSVGSGSVGSCD